MTNGSLMKVKSTAECSPLSILQFLSNNQSCKPFFGLFESGQLTQILLYIFFQMFFKQENSENSELLIFSFNTGLVLNLGHLPSQAHLRIKTDI